MNFIMNNIDKAYLNIINRKNIISENYTFDNVYDEFLDAADSFIFNIANSTNKIEKKNILNDFIKYTNGYYNSPMFDKKFIFNELYNQLKETDINIVE